MSKKVFISYRRDDAKWQARELYRALIQVLPRDQVFMDVDSIPPGADFVDVLEGWVGQCDILLALIGSNWTEIVDPKTGKRRLENPQDFVRIEVRKALERNIPVVPVLLDGAPIPDADRLPDDLKRLVRRNAEFVEHRTVDTDVERLIKKLGLVQTRVASLRPGPIVDHHRAEGRVKIDAKVVHGAPEGWFLPGNGKAEWFKDHEQGPEMVIVPSGSFTMGSPSGEERWSSYDGREEPQRKVTITKPFAVGRHAVTFEEWDACVAAGGCGGYRPADQGWGRGRRPVINVNWDDAKAYAAWLSQTTGMSYRLLSEAEREYVARAGTTTPFWWGGSISPNQANYDGNDGYGGGVKGEYRQKTVPVDSFDANPWGLYQVHGNIWEWCEDIWHDNYNGAPADGSVWLQGGVAGRRVVRGGSWIFNPLGLRSAFRYGYSSDLRDYILGFRVGRTLSP